MKLSTTPAQDGFYFPAEFQPVSEVWLAWPERKDNWRDGALPAQETFARIANLIAEVTKVCVAVCSHNFDRARQMLHSDVRLVEIPFNDACEFAILFFDSFGLHVRQRWPSSCCLLRSQPPASNAGNWINSLLDALCGSRT